METMAKTILIVEDDFNIADLLRLYLEKDGYTVHMAPDGGKGVELFSLITWAGALAAGAGIDGITALGKRLGKRILQKKEPIS